MARPDGYEVEDYSTERADDAVRFDAWIDHVRRNHGGLDLRTAVGTGFTGRTRVQRTADLQIVAFESDPIAYRRTASSARTDCDDTMRVVLPSRGSLAVEVEGVETLIGPGQAAAVSMASPFAISHPASTLAYVLSFPAEAWRGRDPRVARSIDLTAGSGVLVASLVRDLVRHRHDLDGAAFTASVDLLLGLLARTVEQPEQPVGLYESLAEFIARHSDDTSLTPARIADRMGWSLRSLQIAAKARGETPTVLLRQARVRRARARLGDPLWQDRSIAAVAHASGFGSLSAFYEAFAREGDLPSELRPP